MNIQDVKIKLQSEPNIWMVTGCAGFIGSHLIEELLKLNQKVVGLDNLSTGYLQNLDDIKEIVGSKLFETNFKFINGDIQNYDTCIEALKGVNIVLHQGALGSVPRSIEDPCKSNSANVDGTLNIFFAAKNSNIKRIVYASSSSVYGNDISSPKKELVVGDPLSPYAITKKVNELYASVFSNLYDMEIVGLRYFNVFGPRQDPNGSYAAVIPKWVGQLLNGETCTVYGDGETSRDFCYVKNVVQANILAATSNKKSLIAGKVFNVAVGDTTSLKQLYDIIVKSLSDIDIIKLFSTSESSKKINFTFPELHFSDFRKGDIRHSLADISSAKNILEYTPNYRLEEGMIEATSWYVQNHFKRAQTKL